MGIYLDGSAAQLTGNTIQNNQFVGIRALNGSLPTLTANTITGSNRALEVDLESAGLTLAGNVIAGNGENGIRVSGGTLGADTTWAMTELYRQPAMMALPRLMWHSVTG